MRWSPAASEPLVPLRPLLAGPPILPVLPTLRVALLPPSTALLLRLLSRLLLLVLARVPLRVETPRVLPVGVRYG